MTNYARMYRFGITPWERYATMAAASIAARLDREQAERAHPPGRPAGRPPGREAGCPPGRALDLGCGTGTHAIYLAHHGWRATGIDFIPQAIDTARQKARAAGVSPTFLEGDVSRLDAHDLGQDYSLVLDFGCFHGLSDHERDRYVSGVNRAAAPDAVLLILAFQPGRRGPGPRGVSREELARRFAGWAIEREQAIPTDRLPRFARRAAPAVFFLRRHART